MESSASAAGEHCSLDINDVKKRVRQLKRHRLRAKIAEIQRTINVPLADIVRLHVLHRLPVKSLHRFRAVCSAWNESISTPIFAHANSSLNRSISGVFFRSPAIPFAPFLPSADTIPDPQLLFLPSAPDMSVESSSNGLLCLSDHGSTYYVCNPATAQWAALPPPPLSCGPRGSAAALVFDPDVYNFRSDYHLVVAFPIEGAHGMCGFETYTSEAGAWWVSDEVCAAEMVVVGSGVSAGGTAWWRTTMQTVVGYDPRADRVRVVPWPAGYEEDVEWELGEMAGRLCCTTVTDTAVTVYALEASDGWVELASFPVEAAVRMVAAEVIEFKERPVPVRFQSGDMELVVWAGRRVIGVDLARRRTRTIEVEADAAAAPYTGGGVVSHINTLAPVFPPPLDGTHQKK